MSDNNDVNLGGNEACAKERMLSNNVGKQDREWDFADQD